MRHNEGNFTGERGEAVTPKRTAPVVEWRD